MSKVPYIGFSSGTLDELPTVKAGDLIICPHCHTVHEVEPCDDGSFLLGFYKGGDTPYLAAVNGRLVAGVKADCSRSVDF